MLIVNEPGLYRLIFASRKPEAEKFQDWVYHEFIPAAMRGEIIPPAKEILIPSYFDVLDNWQLFLLLYAQVDDDDLIVQRGEIYLDFEHLIEHIKEINQIRYGYHAELLD